MWITSNVRKGEFNVKKLTCMTLASFAILFAGCLSDSGKTMHIENLPTMKIPGLLSPREAVDKALAHAELDYSSVTLKKCEKDIEWGTIVYEIEFHRGFFEYEYEVDAHNGKILTSGKSWDW